jgi:tripartite-type tricarboxylate transporter receptor subunit TctC
MKGEVQMRSSRVTIAATAAILVTFTPVMAQTVADFYRGKTVQLLVGYPPGGGFDVYARAVGRFMGKHIPGNPTVIINNMPGASSLQLIRYLLTVAPTDGTQFGMFNRGLMQQSMLNPEKIDVDFTRFTWIGSMNSELNVCYIWGTKGIDTIERMKKASITLGETSQNSAGYIYTAILRSLTPDCSPSAPVSQIYGCDLRRVLVSSL